jgi:peptidoglycan hydrolase-like protein with peptidoglycan-binding domain
MRRILSMCMIVALAALPLMTVAQPASQFPEGRSSEGYQIPEGAEPRPAVETPPAQPSLREPQDHNAIRRAQIALRDAGFDPGMIDGVMGPRSREALSEFQASRGLPRTGRLDAATQEELLAARTPKSSGRHEAPRSGLVAPGSSGVGTGR